MSSNSPPLTAQVAKPQRVLACILCQQRKIKCDRKFPCIHCVKSRVQCVPATLAQRRRRRRFPERDLLQRLRKYEDLLRQHKISFDPLHKDPSDERGSRLLESEQDSDEEHTESAEVHMPTPSTIDTAKSERSYEVKSIWHAMTRQFRESDEASDSSHEIAGESIVKKAWDQAVLNDDHLLFGSRRAAVDLSTLHPDPVHIFKLWQTYLDNVDPMVKVTHTPTLQGRIIEAVGNVAQIDPNLEALMFGIYCMAILSLTEEACQAAFGTTQKELLTRYQFACQQALYNCEFLRTDERDCIIALFLYLLSIKTSTIPPTLFAILGTAIRSAQRLGFYTESALARCTIFEAEMRRRLWWSLVLFDARMAEMASVKTITLDPTWDAKTVLDVNDMDLRPSMKEPPKVQRVSTDAIFAVVRSEIGNFMRHSGFHLDFTNPTLRPLAKYAHDNPDTEVNDLIEFEERIENEYLKFCDPDIPIHFMTMWSTRGYIARCHLLQYFGRPSTFTSRQTGSQLDRATFSALRMLECDTKIMKSPLTKGFLWYNHNYFPFPAYLQIAQDLRSRPLWEHAAQAWEVMSENRAIWFTVPHFDPQSPFFTMFSKMIMHSWDGYETANVQAGKEVTTPKIVTSIREIMAQQAPPRAQDDGGGGAAEQQQQHHQDLNLDMDMGFDDFQMPLSMMPLSTSMPGAMPMQMPTPADMGFSDQSQPPQNMGMGMGIQDNFGMMSPGGMFSVGGVSGGHHHHHHHHPPHPLHSPSTFEHLHRLRLASLWGRPGWGAGGGTDTGAGTGTDTGTGGGGVGSEGAAGGG